MLMLQTDRFLQIHSSLAENQLLLRDMHVEEKMSGLFIIKLNLLSPSETIDPKQIIHQSMSVAVHAKNNQEPRYFHGIVQAFTAQQTEGGYRHYSATLIPWLGLLHYTNNYRIFQHKSVIDITRQLCRDINHSDINFSQLNQTYPPKDYCVQYHETTAHFLQRIWAESGIFFFFKHSKDKHTLVLADNSLQLSPCLDYSAKVDESGHSAEQITRWIRTNKLYSGKIEKGDYNYHTPDISLHTSQSQTAQLNAAQTYDVYHYPAGHQVYKNGETIAQHYFEEQQTHYDTIVGESNYSAFTTGGKFNLAQSSQTPESGDYLITSVIHIASDNSYEHTGQQHYHNLFTSIPAQVSLRKTTIAKPKIFGAQSAIVVGPKDEEIYTDDYGRVKVQFFWDRYGKQDENTTCWIRVAQNWAGKNWGTLFLPRIGHEVIVQFLDGDPDRPLIIGSVYNAENPTPYSLPSEQTKSGIKTHSSKYAGPNQYNELRFEDKLGQEEIYIQAEKNFTRLIKNNESALIKQDKTETVEGNKTVLVLKGNYQITVTEGRNILEAAQEILFKVGNSSIQILPDKIVLNSMTIKLNN